jgi:hypothetical protein
MFSQVLSPPSREADAFVVPVVVVLRPPFGSGQSSRHDFIRHTPEASNTFVPSFQGMISLKSLVEALYPHQ